MEMAHQSKNGKHRVRVFLSDVLDEEGCFKTSPELARLFWGKHDLLMSLSFLVKGVSLSESEKAMLSMVLEDLQR